MDNPKQASQLLEKLKKQQESADGEALARQIGNDWEGANTIEGTCASTTQLIIRNECFLVSSCG